MNFEEFSANPYQYISNLAQVSDEVPDLGLKRCLDEYFSANPDAFNNVPLVSSMGDLNMHQPGSLIRLRCQFIKPCHQQTVVMRTADQNGHYFTGIIDQKVPEESELSEPDSYQMRLLYLVTSIPSISPWLIDQMIPDQPQTSNPHINLEESMPIDRHMVFEEPFQIVIKVLFEIPDKMSVKYDMIGFLEEPSELPYPSYIPEQDFYSTVPSFVALTFSPVHSLFSPTISPPVPSFSEIRGHLMNVLTTVFEPRQAELILIWLVSRVQARNEEVILGHFSLNLFGVSPELASPIISFLKFLCSAVTCVSLNCDSLNSMSLKPLITLDNFKPTPLSSAAETRFIIDETCLDEGKFSEVGVENLRMLQAMVNDQIVHYHYEVDDYSALVSYPTLVLSNSRSLLGTNVYFPIGNVKQANVNIDPSMLTLIRMYVEEARFHNFQMSDTDRTFVEDSLKHLLIEYPMIRGDLHTFMIVNQLNCISLGVQSMTKEIWEHSVAIIMESLQYKKPQ